MTTFHRNPLDARLASARVCFRNGDLDVIVSYTEARKLKGPVPSRHDESAPRSRGDAHAHIRQPSLVGTENTVSVHIMVDDATDAASCLHRYPFLKLLAKRITFRGPRLVSGHAPVDAPQCRTTEAIEVLATG